MCSPTLAAGVITAMSAAYGAYTTSQIKPPVIPKQPLMQPQQAPQAPGAAQGQNFDPRRMAALMGMTQGGTTAPGSLFAGGTIGG